ncbi:hypothetical protein SIO70_19125 [Chitinophaga sancti]|uniref:hypothetical protein n=1 Tax=Chitinophaga sancti TaxID=1004 RepID=UPI002A7481FD|nr:hypothetical protein [Chitinophaga sancti]WPQ60463.1 hypothetical protein SIO70_19125 [Chitinophaga sancti]
MKNYQKAFSVIVSVVFAGAALGAFLAKTEKGKKILSDIRKKKECHNREGVEAL